jgi:hypothetical protein
MALLDPESPFRDEMSLELRVEAETGPIESTEDETDLLTPLLAQEWRRREEADDLEVVSSEPEEQLAESRTGDSITAPDEEVLTLQEPEVDLESIEEAPFDLPELEDEGPFAD